ncbi:MAG: response regulator [Paracoccaceae bacterium]
MPDTIEDLVMLQPPTAERPLLGAMILVVEDSRHACEALRLICQRSGARIRRAESLASAERHLRTYRPRLAVVDLGLPDGSGLNLISQLDRGDPRIDGIIATSGDESLKDAAMNAGADAFLAKPLASVSHFQRTALGLMPDGLRNIPVSVGQQDNVEPEPIALRDDLALAAELLRVGADERTLDYVSGFLSGLGKCAHRPSLSRLGETIGGMAKDGAMGDADLIALALKIDDEAAALELV